MSNPGGFPQAYIFFIPMNNRKALPLIPPMHVWPALEVSSRFGNEIGGFVQSGILFILSRVFSLVSLDVSAHTERRITTSHR